LRVSSQPDPPPLPTRRSSDLLTGVPAGEATEFTPVAATPAEVTFDDQDGTADDTFTVPTTVGVQYYVGDQVIDAGTHPGEGTVRSEEHTSELQSRENLVCRLL